MKVEYFLDRVYIAEQQDGPVPKVGEYFLVAKDSITNVKAVVESVILKKRGIDVFFQTT